MQTGIGTGPACRYIKKRNEGLKYFSPEISRSVSHGNSCYLKICDFYSQTVKLFADSFSSVLLN